MGELNNLVVIPINNGDETRARGHHRFFWVFWAPSCIKCRDGCLVELDCKDLRKFVDAKRANRHCETLKQSLGVFSFPLVNTQQRAPICFVQRLRQVV